MAFNVDGNIRDFSFNASVKASNIRMKVVGICVESVD